ncbi:hypothetical protein PCANC_08935 [Puccinia coronata f. sp. avenae]|uniref:Uncharacterized protein n=1 Tax=Puccinia coronata f. sp. avenae TaxID=200324 RepID=A0A2N5T2F8_9BASI|nr:hypothetical protein PCANC_08935 [Puccinia coronata f. sp. avenae]
MVLYDEFAKPPTYMVNFPLSAGADIHLSRCQLVVDGYDMASNPDQRRLEFFLGCFFFALALVHEYSPTSLIFVQNSLGNCADGLEYTPSEVRFKTHPILNRSLFGIPTLNCHPFKRPTHAVIFNFLSHSIQNPLPSKSLVSFPSLFWSCEGKLSINNQILHVHVSSLVDFRRAPDTTVPLVRGQPKFILPSPPSEYATIYLADHRKLSDNYQKYRLAPIKELPRLKDFQLEYIKY